MSAVIVYESMFGSTKAVAEAVAEGLEAAHVPARVVEVGALLTEGGDLPDGTDLLVLGGPTHAFGLSREQTRHDAATKTSESLVSQGPGLREWLAAARLPKGLPVAVFDTKVDKPMLPGSAARAAARRLGSLGVRPVASPQSFKVRGMTEGLVDGQLDAARRWGTGLASAVGARS